MIFEEGTPLNRERASRATLQYNFLYFSEKFYFFGFRIFFEIFIFL